MFAAFEKGRSADYYESLVVRDEEVERGTAAGRLVVDTRLRDALRQIGGPATSRSPSRTPAWSTRRATQSRPR